MKYGYARVSTDEQNVQQQVDHLVKRYGIEPEHVYYDVFTGTTLDRPQFNKLIQRLNHGDVLHVYHVSRLGRKTTEVLTLVEDLQARGVGIVVEQLDSMDITKGAGKLVFTMLAGLEEMERTDMLERQRIGIERAKAEGKYTGRKPVDPEVIDTAVLLRSQGLSVAKTAKQLGIGESTLYRELAKRKAS